MVIARIESLLLDEGVTHISTDWQISDKISFETRELESMGDKLNKEAIIFNEVLDPNVKWYARARALLSTGYTIWGNVEIFRPENDNVIDVSEDLPSKIGVPQITTSSLQDNHDVTMFTISASGFETLGNSTHASTSWIIETLEGETIWSSTYNSIDKSSIDLVNYILDANAIYRIKVIFHSTSNDSSPVGSYIIRTTDNVDINLITYIDYVEANKNIELQIFKIENVTSVTWDVLSMANNYAQKIWSTTTYTPSEHTCTLPTTGLASDELFMLKISTNLPELGSKFYPFRTRPYTAEPDASLVVPIIEETGPTVSPESPVPPEDEEEETPELTEGEQESVDEEAREEEGQEDS